MMQKTVVIFIMLISISSYLFSQNVIKGKVVDVNQNPVEGFNALLLQKDSTMIKGGFFFDGNYKIIGIKGHYILQISALGYQTHESNILVKDSITEIPTIVLESSTISLNEVKVKGIRNLYSRQDNKLIVNVKNTILEESGRAVDVMRKSALLAVDGDNKVSVLGKGKTAVYVNGKQISSPELLNMISSKEIQSIEVIDNPSAKYSSDIQAVVNIVTYNKINDKQGFTLVNTLTKRNEYSNNTNVQYFNNSNKNNLFISYSYGNYLKDNEEEYKRQYPKYVNKTTILNAIDKQLHITNKHYGKISNTYELNRYNIVTLAANVGYYNGAYRTLNINKMLKNNLVSDVLFTNIHSPVKRT